jgi:hypothetical protein
MAEFSLPSQKLLVMVESFPLVSHYPNTIKPSRSMDARDSSAIYSQFFKHKLSLHLYYLQDDILTKIPIQQTHRLQKKAKYQNVPYQCELTFTNDEFLPVDIYYSKHGISSIGPFPTSTRIIPSTSSSHISILNAFSSLPSALQCICGTVNFPPDGGTELLQCMHHQGNNLLFGASDASLKGGRSPTLG